MSKPKGFTRTNRGRKTRCSSRKTGKLPDFRFHFWGIFPDFLWFYFWGNLPDFLWVLCFICKTEKFLKNFSGFVGPPWPWQVGRRTPCPPESRYDYPVTKWLTGHKMTHESLAWYLLESRNDCSVILWLMSHWHQTCTGHWLIGHWHADCNGHKMTHESWNLG